MEKPKIKHRPRRLRARPLLVAAAISMVSLAGCEGVNGSVPNNLNDLSVVDLPAPVDLGLAPRD